MKIARIEHRSFCLTPLALIALSAVSHAALVVSESFVGYDEGNINGQAATGLGLAGNWTASSFGHHQIQNSGLALTGAYSSGGSVNLSSGGNNTYRATAAFGSALPAGQLYGSYLFSTTTHVNARTVGSLAVGSADNNNDGNAAFVWAGNGYNSNDSTHLESPGVRAQGSNTWSTPSASLTGGETYLMLFQFNATTGATTAWVLNQAQLTNYLDLGLNASNLNEAGLGTGATDVVWRDSQTAATAIGAISYLHLFGLQGANTTASPDNSSFSFTWDEFRVSDSSLLEAVTVPEPSTLTLGLALGAFALRRRRRA